MIDTILKINFSNQFKATKYGFEFYEIPRIGEHLDLVMQNTARSIVLEITDVMHTLNPGIKQILRPIIIASHNLRFNTKKKNSTKKYLSDCGWEITELQ